MSSLVWVVFLVFFLFESVFAFVSTHLLGEDTVQPKMMPALPPLLSHQQHTTSLVTAHCLHCVLRAELVDLLM